MANVALAGLRLLDRAAEALAMQTAWKIAHPAAAPEMEVGTTDPGAAAYERAVRRVYFKP